MGSDSGRIRFISFLQISGVILVILGHSLHEYPGDFHQFWFYRMFQTVRMPLFVFISGFLFMLSMRRHGREMTLSGFVKNKSQRLLVPYLFLGVITFVPRVLMSGYADDVMTFGWQEFVDSILYADRLSIVFLWFLPVIFMMLCLAFAGMRLFRDRMGLFFLAGGVLGIAGYFFAEPEEWTFLGIGRMGRLALYFMVGMVYGHWKRDIDLWLGRWWAGGLCGSLWLALFHLDMDSDVMRLICSLSGLGMLICLSLSLCERRLGWRHLEGYNYMMYLLSWFTCVASQQILHHFTDFPWWVYTVLALLTSIYIPWSIGKILHRSSPHSRMSRACLWLLGHNPHKTSYK